MVRPFKLDLNLYCLIHSFQNRVLTINTNDLTINDIHIRNKNIQCQRKYNLTSMDFICPYKFSSNQIEINDLNSTILESILFLRIISEKETKRSLKTIPSNICRLTKLQSLNLAFNRIENLDFNSTDLCLRKLRILELSNNRINNISASWFNRLYFLEHLDLSSNRLTDLPYDIFQNFSYLRTLNVSNNFLKTIELWTVLIQDTVTYQSNKIDRFSNEYNVDLSQLSITRIPQFNIDKYVKIDFDDTIFSMYNRCAEVHHISDYFKNYTPILTLAILSILKLNRDKYSFYSDCSCNRFYFYQTAFAIEGYPNNASADTWICSGHSKIYIQKCNNRSSANFNRVLPRLCKIDQFETGTVPVYVRHSRSTTIDTTQQTTTSISISSLNLEEIEQRLDNIGVLNNSTIETFMYLINAADYTIKTTLDSQISERIKQICQKIICHIENLIESINVSLNNNDGTFALISTTKTNPIYYFNQYILPNSTIIHSSQSNVTNSIANIFIEQKYIQQLSKEKFYSLFFLPLSIFQYAQVNSQIEILSSIVGAHLSIEQSLKIQMSFNINNHFRSSGYYSCVFWQFDRWNNTGCQYLMNTTTNRHQCFCNHLTSFALIFTPDGILPATFLPTIVMSFLSIIGLSISIILSIYQQIKAQAIHRFSIVNIFSLTTTLLLFILCTILLIINHQSSRTQSIHWISCSSSMLNLVLTIYFFVILTFTSKTFLGIYYYFKIFGDFKPHCLNKRTNRYHLMAASIMIVIPLVLTIIASAISHREDSIIVSKNNICWFRETYLFGFVTIPVSIFIGINIIIVLVITIILFRFLCNTNVKQAKEKRLIVIVYIWIASCVLLGIVWIVGPLLNLFVNENGESISTSSKAIQWIFGLFIGLEGVWVLIVNILFCTRHRTNEESHQSNSIKWRKKWQRIHIHQEPTVNHDNYRNSHK